VIACGDTVNKLGIAELERRSVTTACAEFPYNKLGCNPLLTVSTDKAGAAA
jgi:hypothetical protein